MQTLLTQKAKILLPNILTNKPEYSIIALTEKKRG